MFNFSSKLGLFFAQLLILFFNQSKARHQIIQLAIKEAARNEPFIVNYSGNLVLEDRKRKKKTQPYKM